MIKEYCSKEGIKCCSVFGIDKNSNEDRFWEIGVNRSQEELLIACSFGYMIPDFVIDDF